jgi:hypothetical protein
LAPFPWRALDATGSVVVALPEFRDGERLKTEIPEQF